MKQILIVGAIAAVCVVVAASLGFLPTLGIIVDTNTKGYNWCGDDPVRGLTTPELTDETELVTAWKSGANSVKLTMQGNVKFPNCNGWNVPEFSPIRYYYKVFIIDQVHSDWYEIMNADDYDRDIVHITHPTTGFFGRKYFSGINYAWKDAPLKKEDGSILQKSYKHGVLGLCGRFTTCTGDAYGIEIKGPHVGALKVEFWVEVHCQWLWNVHGEPRRFQKDEVKLLDGTGSIEVLPRGSMDPDASGYYVFEEGDDVTFEMDTGFSGKRQGGDVSSQGWELRVYNPSGERVKEWDIPDDKRGYERTFTIPKGSWNAQGSNQWKVELYNSLFKQDEKDFFTVDCIDKIPGTPVISFDKVAYDQGDTCIATATSEGNPSTGLGVYEFRIKAYYQGTIDYLYDEYVAAYSMGGNQYSASASFTMTRGDRYVVVESQAFDGRHDVGGRPSFAGKNIVWVRDKDPEPDTFVLDVYVRDEDKELVEGATVDCGTKTVKTGTDGKASFIGLPKDTYEVKAKKEGVGSGKETVVLDSDKAITIDLIGEDDGEIPYLAVIVAIIIAGVFIAAAIFVPGGIYVKMLVVILGIVAVVVYLLLGGVIWI